MQIVLHAKVGTIKLKVSFIHASGINKKLFSSLYTTSIFTNNLTDSLNQMGFPFFSFFYYPYYLIFSLCI